MKKKNKKESSLGFNIKVKVGLLTTVAKSIYADTLMKIREAVANSKDNSATKFVFTLKKEKDQNEYTLSLFDNGTGITKKRYKEIFQSLGYGLHRDDINSAKFYSYFGLGLMSVLQLGNKVTIITKPKDSGEINKLVVDSKTIFSKEMEKEHLDALSKYIIPSDTNLSERDLLSPLSKDAIKASLKKIPDSFTEVIIEDLTDDDIALITDGKFVDNIRKILPLPVEESDSFLMGLKKGDRENILKVLKSKKYCPTIEFLYSGDAITPHRLLKKYFPQFPHPYAGNDYQFYKGTNNNEFAHYFLAAGSDRGVVKGGERETGIWTRNKNFLVKAADYLQYQGYPSFVRDAIKGWIFGEIYHKDMNEFLEVSRKDYIVSSDKFKIFRSDVKKIVKKISDERGEVYEVTSKIVETIKGPLEQFEDLTKSPFKQLESNLAKIENLKIEDIVGEKAKEVLHTLNKIRSPQLEGCDEVVKILKEKNKPIVLAEDNTEGNKYQVKIDPSAKEQLIVYNHKTNGVEATIPSAILDRKLVRLFGNDYTVYFRDGRNIDKGISFDADNRQIHVNLFYRDFKKHSVTFLDVLIAAEYAAHASECTDPIERECMDNMKNTILQFLGAEYENLASYVDDLAKYL